MGSGNQINFFWSGDKWTYLHDMTIKSHIRVGHMPIIWIHGDPPKSVYWDISVYQKSGRIKDACQVVNIDAFMKKGGNFKTASSLWRFVFLYKNGGWYSDTDAIAIKPWPNEPWVLCGEKPGMLSTGVIKAPWKQQMFIDMIGDLKLDWGNVKIFNKHYFRYKRNINETIDSKLFYPFGWTEWNRVMENGDIPDVYSVHLYHTMFEREGIIDNIKEIIKESPGSILSKMDRFIYAIE